MFEIILGVSGFGTIFVTAVIATLRKISIERQKEIDEINESTKTEDTTSSIYKEVKAYANRVSIIARVKLSENKHDADTPIFFHNKEEVTFNQYVNVLATIVNSLKEDKDNLLYSHLCIDDRYFFSIFCPIINKPAKDYDIVQNYAGREQQFLSMTHDYHLRISNRIKEYKESLSQDALLELEQAYLYSNPTADVKALEQEKQLKEDKPPVKNTLSGYVKTDYQRKLERMEREDKEAIQQKRKLLSQRINKVFAKVAVYQDTRVELPPGTTKEEAKIALARIYPELNHSRPYEMNGEIHFEILTTNEFYGKSIKVSYNGTTILFAPHTSLEHIRNSIANIYPEINNSLVRKTADGYNFYQR